MEIKKDCFAYRDGNIETCTALESLACKNCKFYISKEEFLAKRDEVNKRLKARED